MSIQFQVQSRFLSENHFAIGDYLGQAVDSVKLQGGYRCSFSTKAKQADLENLSVGLLRNLEDITYLRACFNGVDVCEYSQGTMKRNGRPFGQGFH